MSIKDITVIIASFKSEGKIEKCLNSIDRQVKVILVENSNNIELKRKIESEYKNVKCILTGSNLGYGGANNIGLKNVETQYDLILNPDATLRKSTLENFIKIIKKISDFAIIGPFNQNNNINKSHKGSTEPIAVNNIKGYGMFLNLSKFKDIGFFDDNFFFYFEEIDLCTRVINSGKKIFIAPGIEIDHDGGQSHDDSINETMELSRNWHWMWSTFYYNKKYKGFFTSLIITFPKLFSALFKVLFYTLIFNNKKKIYYCRLSGLFNAIIGRKSWYRPKV